MAVANVAISVRDGAGRFLTAWSGHNVICNGARSAVNRFLVGQSQLPASYLEVGSGSATPLATDTGCQYVIYGKTPADTMKPTAATSAIGASGFTARSYFVLGPNEYTGTIREAALRVVPGLTPGYAHVLVNGGTGIVHASGQQATLYWDLVLGTGQQPF